MKKLYLFLFSTTFISHANAIPQNCPARDAIHCSYVAQKTEPKWVKVTMQPRNIVIHVCMRQEDVLYLERDDIEHDGTKPGTRMSWEFQQCADEDCIKTKPIGVDQFILTYANNHYDTEPFSYAINIDASYGKKCQPTLATPHHYF